ncbi:latent-transforming growth factor beta-binding protein 1-like [Macrobrachium nipponense]|uniref:latent-transforming growth factor beta-binding protein 1-like n=1 Tax=Macrobrachium nipponense TaxID=159736 RepID=UPI0030C7D4B3
MRTTMFLLFSLFFSSPFTRSEVTGKASSRHPSECKPSADCIANGGYCINNSHKSDCKGLLFSKECISTQCSCCIDAPWLENECATGGDTCPANSACQDKDVGYECLCDPGFAQCGDMNECDSNPCGANSQCHNTYGSYDCVCNAGYEKINGACVDVIECNMNACGANGVCTNTPGSFSCSCNAGYTEMEGICVDVDECQCGPCSSYSTCKNTPGSYLCECLAGFSGVAGSGSCTDINECASSPCQLNQNCINSPGSYSCSCHACKDRCEHNGTYILLLSRCVRLITGNMTYYEAEARCRDDYNGWVDLTSQFDVLFRVELLPNISDKAWVKDIAIYPNKSVNECTALVKGANPYNSGIFPCDTVMNYAVCEVQKNW